MEIALLTSEAQADQLRGVEFALDSYCNPVQDGLGRWVISLQEMVGFGLELQVVEWIAPKSDELNNVSDGINT